LSVFATAEQAAGHTKKRRVVVLSIETARLGELEVAWDDSELQGHLLIRPKAGSLDAWVQSRELESEAWHPYSTELSEAVIGQQTVTS
jgi:hypothetical protein